MYKMFLYLIFFHIAAVGSLRLLLIVFLQHCDTLSTFIC